MIAATDYSEAEHQLSTSKAIEKYKLPQMQCIFKRAVILLKRRWVYPDLCSMSHFTWLTVQYFPVDQQNSTPEFSRKVG